MRQYHELMQHVLEHGAEKSDRTGTGTRSVFGWQMRFKLEEGFPLITTKKLHTKSIIHELLWFLRGETNVKSLQAAGVSIWDEWADAQGELGPIYGRQWRSWPAPSAADPGRTIDQIQNLMQELKTNPNSRRLIVNAWNVSQLDQMALAPCHTMFQFYVAKGKLSCQLYQRSADIFLGVPFNIASYALLTHLVSDQSGFEPGDFIWTGGDCHLYNNHIEQAKEQLSRSAFPLPRLKLNRRAQNIFSYSFEDVVIEGYTHHPAIKAEVAV